MILEVQNGFFPFLCNDLTCVYKVHPFSVLHINPKAVKYTLTATVKHPVLFMCGVRAVLPVYLNCRAGKLCEVGFESKAL